MDDWLQRGGASASTAAMDSAEEAGFNAADAASSAFGTATGQKSPHRALAFSVQRGQAMVDASAAADSRSNSGMASSAAAAAAGAAMPQETAPDADVLASASQQIDLEQSNGVSAAAHLGPASTSQVKLWQHALYP